MRSTSARAAAGRLADAASAEPRADPCRARSPVHCAGHRSSAPAAMLGSMASVPLPEESHPGRPGGSTTTATRCTTSAARQACRSWSRPAPAAWQRAVVPAGADQRCGLQRPVAVRATGSSAADRAVCCGGVRRIRPWGRVVVIGSSNVDLVVAADRLPARRDGARWPVRSIFRRQGAEPGGRRCARGSIGHDGRRSGPGCRWRRISVALTAEAIDVSRVRRTDVPTGVAIIAVAADGENQIVVAPSERGGLGR